MNSPKYTLNTNDLQTVALHALIFAGPAILVLLASAISVIPTNSQYGVLGVYALNIVTDLLRKFLNGQPKSPAVV